MQLRCFWSDGRNLVRLAQPFTDGKRSLRRVSGPAHPRSFGPRSDRTVRIRELTPQFRHAANRHINPRALRLTN